MSNFTVNLTAEHSSTFSILPVNLFETLLYSIVLFLGLPIISYVFSLIVAEAKCRVASEFFNMNLFVCEIANCMNCLLALLCIWFTAFELPKYFFIGVGITGRPLFQCLICVERYAAVVHPVTFLKYKPLRYRVVCSVMAWIITIGSCVCCMLTMSSNKTFYLWFFSPQFLLFFFIQLFCLVAVLRALKQSGPGDRKKEEENRMKRKAFHLILITSVSMIITYTPFSLSGFIFIFSENFISELFYFGLVFFALAGFFQPLIYLHRVGKISTPCCS